MRIKISLVQYPVFKQPNKIFHPCKGLNKFDLQTKAHIDPE